MTAARMRLTLRLTGLEISGIVLITGSAAAFKLAGLTWRAFGLPKQLHPRFACAEAGLTEGLVRMCAAVQEGK